MNLFLIVLKASGVMGAAAIVSALRYRRSSASFRHLVWTLAVAGLLALPALSAGLPGWHVAMPAAFAPDAAIVVAASDTSQIASSTPVTTGAPEAMANTTLNRGASLAPVLPGVYLAGVILLLLRLVYERWLVRRLTRLAADVEDGEWTRLLSDCARQVGVRPHVRLLRSLERSMPMAFGTRTPTILIPAVADTWTEDRRRAVLLHELAHIVRHDCVTQLMASVACAIYWFHPGVWWTARRLRVERELACDDRVISAGAPAHDYAGHLLELAYALGDYRAPALVVSMARRGQVEGRMLAVLDAARNRAVPAWRGRVAAAAIAAALLVPLAGVRGIVVSAKVGDARVAAPAAAGQDAAAAPVSGSAVAGTWEIRATQASEAVNLRLSENAHSSHGSTVALDRFQGLAPTLLSSSGPATFSLRRAAGTFAFEGMFRSGTGAGTYTFVPSASFPAELEARGFARPTAAEQYLLAREDVAFAFIDELAAQHYARPDLHQLVNAAQDGVDLGYLREMGGLGYRFAQLDALIGLRDHGVSPQYIRELGAQGLTRLTADDLVRARDHGVSAQYVADLTALGYGSLSLDDLVGARDHGVSPGYARELRQLGYPRLSLGELITARDHGVSPEYVRELQGLGYRLTLDELMTARNHGISAGYIRQLQSQGRSSLTLDELVTLRQQGSGYRETRLMYYVSYHVQAFHRWVREFADRWSK
jgi:beta-lactamase regulating signal transducer with metallopeptidase domain